MNTDETRPSSRRHRLAAAAILLALLGPAAASTAFAAPASAQPAKSCVDDPDQAGCSHDTKDGGDIPTNWIADQYGEPINFGDGHGDTYWRIDGGLTNASEGKQLAQDLFYKSCKPTPGNYRLNCTGSR